MMITRIRANLEYDLKKNYCSFNFKAVRDNNSNFIFRKSKTSFFPFISACNL